VLAALGTLTRLLRPGLPADWREAAPRLPALLLMPGFIEEVLFRGLLLRKCAGEKGGASPTGDPQSPGYRRWISSASLPTLWGSKCEAEPAAESLTPKTCESMCQDMETGSSGSSACEGQLAKGNPEAPQAIGAGMEKTTPALAEKEVQAPECCTPALGSVVQCSSAKGFEGGEDSLPRPPWLEQVAALCIFVIYHLDAIHVWELFRDPRFLLLAGILGMCCQEALLCSWSLWPGVILHGLWVWAWFTFGCS